MMDLLKFLPKNDPTRKDQLLSLAAIKLFFGTCLQLCFQAVLLGGYTSHEDVKTSQVFSIVSSVITLLTTTATIVMLQRSKENKECDKMIQKMKKKKWIKQQIKHIILTLLYLLTSLIFQTGTLILTILVAECYAIIYVIFLLVLNIILFLLRPLPLVKKYAEKFTYNISNLERLEVSGIWYLEVSKETICHGLISSWTNLFIVLPPGKNISHKIINICLFQLIRFLLNMITLLLLILMTYAPSATKWPLHHYDISVIIAYIVVFVAGLINLLLMVQLFFSICLSNSHKPEDVEMKDIEVQSELGQEPSQPESGERKEEDRLLSEIKVGTNVISSSSSLLQTSSSVQQCQHTSNIFSCTTGCFTNFEVDEKEEIKEASDHEENEENETDSDKDQEHNNKTLHQLESQVSQVSVRSMAVDGSCFFDIEDLGFLKDIACIPEEEAKQTLNVIQEQGGKVDKDMFIRTMMEFFPRYNMVENKKKLNKLFDRLDNLDEKVVNFRQFLLVAIAFSNGSLKDKITRIFKLMDKDDSGELTYEDFQEVLRDILVLKEERKISVTMVEERFSRSTFREMGLNADGKSNLTSFVEACTRSKFIAINYVENFRDGFLLIE